MRQDIRRFCQIRIYGQVTCWPTMLFHLKLQKMNRNPQDHGDIRFKSQLNRLEQHSREEISSRISIESRSRAGSEQQF